MSSLLYGVGVADPGTYVMCGIVLLATAAFATAVPAIRALRVHPAAVLRE
jgi:ABC-type lipoprotein release transport system permease subunit